MGGGSWYTAVTLNSFPTNEGSHAQPSGTGDSKILAACPLCRAQYHPLKMFVIGERDGAHVLHLECQQCGSAVVALVQTVANGVTTVGTLTDLTSGEVASASTTTIGHDDVLDLVEWFQQTSSVQLILRREKAYS